MAQVIHYEYIEEISTEDALRSLASDNTNGYTNELPWVNTFLINAENQVINFPEWEWEWIAGWNTDVSWSSSTTGISWTSGNVNLPDWTQVAISSWSVNVSSSTYIYLDQSDGNVYSTTTARNAVWENKIMLCVAFPNSWKKVSFQAFGCADQNSLVTGSSIANNTIVASNIASGTITANEIASGTITANEIASNTITASEIHSWAVTSSKINVSELSAISADLWDITAWTITGTKITAGSTSWTAVVLDPDYNRIRLYYNGSQVWYIMGSSASWLWWVLYIYSNNYIYFSWTAYCGGKLRIPVWTDLYD